VGWIVALANPNSSGAWAVQRKIVVKAGAVFMSENGEN